MCEHPKMNSFGTEILFLRDAEGPEKEKTFQCGLTIVKRENKGQELNDMIDCYNYSKKSAFGAPRQGCGNSGSEPHPVRVSHSPVASLESAR
jgi:hypothetical protein